MTQRTITNVWLEAQFTEDGVKLSLLSEGTEDGTRVEDVEYIDHEMMRVVQDGELFNMNLSEKTSNDLSEMQRLSAIGQLHDMSDEPTGHYDLPAVGDVVHDTGELPSWSEDNRVRVVEVTDTPAEDYVVEDADNWSIDPTVATLNPSEPTDAPVVVGHYVGSEKEYAFPVTRLE